MHRTLRACWLALGASLGLAPAPSTASAAVYQVAVIPQAPPVAMYEKWGPLLAALSERTGATLKAKLYESMDTFEQDFRAGRADFLFAHPEMSVAAHRAQGYLPLVRDRRELAGSIFVRSDSPYREIADLAGKRIAFVGERSFCTVLAQIAMSSAPLHALNLEKSFHGSTRNVVRMVLLGKVEAGASLDVALELEDEETRRLLRPLVRTPPFAPHPLSAHPRVPSELRERIVAAVLGMAGNPAEQPLLAAVRMPEPVRADYQRDYGVLERR